LVTKYRRRVFTGAMLTFCETTMPVRVELNDELIEFNGEADHVHVLVAYPPNAGDLDASAAAQRTHRCAANTPAPASVPACADTPGRRPTSPSTAEARRLSIIKQYIDGQARPL
jgi:putative transposase